MKYKLSSTGEARTDDYMGTVTTLHDSDLERIKENVRIHNRQVRATTRKHGRTIGKLRRVRIMPRGPRAEAAEAMYRSRRAYDSYLPMGLGEYFDIYVGEDSTAQYELERELSTGMSPGELKKIDKLKNEILHIEINARIRKNANQSTTNGGYSNRRY